jgi:hypothetical protein
MSVAGFAAEPVDQVDDVEEATAAAAPDASAGDTDSEVRLPEPAPPTRTRLRCCARKPPPARSGTRVSLTGVPAKANSSISLAQSSGAKGELAPVWTGHLA